MDIDALTDDELDHLASKLAGRLPTGRHGDRIVATKRQVLTVAAGGSVGVAALVRLGIDPATAQSAAGQVGTESSPEDVYAFDLDVQGALQRDLDAGSNGVVNLGSLNGGGPLSDGDGTERQLWVIANGAADPSGADPEDIILEEEA